MGTDCCANVNVKNMLTVGGHVLVSSSTHGIVTDFREYGTLLVESEDVVHELIVTAGIGRVTVHELLAQKRHVAGGKEPRTFDIT